MGIISKFDDGTGLLDGGATHPLRQGSTEEIKNVVQVTVELAHGATQLYQNPVNGRNPLIGGTGGTNCASSRFGGIGIHHHLVPRRMCCEASTTGKHRMLVKVWVSSGSKGPRSGSDH